VDSQFFRRFDLDRVGALGWSRGGATAFQLTLDDARVKAAVNLDGSLFGRSIEREGSDRPLLFIESAGATDSIVESYVDPAELQTLFGIEASVWEMFSRSSEDWYRAKITGVDHGSFSDLPFVVANPSDQPPATSAERAHEIINALLLEFFGKYLNDSDETPLLSDQASWPELHIAKDVATKPF
jgi:dienelactone hydrolase